MSLYHIQLTPSLGAPTMAESGGNPCSQRISRHPARNPPRYLQVIEITIISLYKVNEIYRIVISPHAVSVMPGNSLYFLTLALARLDPSCSVCSSSSRLPYKLNVLPPLPIDTTQAAADNWSLVLQVIHTKRAFDQASSIASTSLSTVSALSLQLCRCDNTISILAVSRFYSTLFTRH
jgi:hypothetical protein